MQDQLNNPGAAPFLFVLALSLSSALFIAYLYVHFYSDRATGTNVYRAFPLLALSITAIFVTVQFSLPLSLGLLGALSIVRFRVPVKEPEEIGFVMLVVAASVAVAAFELALLGAILAVAAGAAAVQSMVFPPDDPPLELRRSVEPVAKAEGA